MRNLTRGLACALLLATLPLAADAAVFVGVSVNIAPPALPVYVQPPCPAPGYIWTPGYWAWADGGYYWVPGTWVLAPVGMLWTPGYWGWAGGAYIWHAGYWGPHVGFYGGVNYGFGYGGVGFEGGYWRGGQLYYNRSVANINTTNITNVYNRTVVNNVNVTRVSYNGGAGGTAARPTAADMAAAREHHMGLTSMQRQQQDVASRNPSMRASFNGGHPAIAATPRAGEFSGRGVVAARPARPGPAQRPQAPHGGFQQPQRGYPQQRGPQQRAYPQQRGVRPERPQERGVRPERPQERGVRPERPQERGGNEPRGEERGH
jgi:hypothetical protein